MGGEATVLQQLELAGIPAQPTTRSWLTQLRDYQRDVREQDGLITKQQAVALLEVSPARITQLIKQGLLQEFPHFKKDLVSAKQCEALYRAKREGGAKGRLISNALKASFKG